VVGAALALAVAAKLVYGAWAVLVLLPILALLLHAVRKRAIRAARQVVLGRAPRVD
jgi:hypothetical protein